ITFSTDVGFARSRENRDGPILGPISPEDGGPFPGEDDPDVYYPVPVIGNTVTGGIDILTNTGTPGGLQAGPGDGGPGGGPDGDDDNDGIPNSEDNCPSVANPDQA